jgi:hypothetical protein
MFQTSAASYLVSEAEESDFYWGGRVWAERTGRLGESWRNWGFGRSAQFFSFWVLVKI